MNLRWIERDGERVLQAWEKHLYREDKQGIGRPCVMGEGEWRDVPDATPAAPELSLIHI